MRQPDIEIYLKNCSNKKVEEWLHARFGVLTPVSHKGNSTSYEVFHENESIPVLLMKSAAGKAYTSLWFDSPASPWNDDQDCAREAYAALEVEVRCNGGFWQEQEGRETEDQWLQIDAEGEKVVSW